MWMTEVFVQRSLEHIVCLATVNSVSNSMFLLRFTWRCSHIRVIVKVADGLVLVWQHNICIHNDDIGSVGAGWYWGGDPYTMNVSEVVLKVCWFTSCIKMLWDIGHCSVIGTVPQSQSQMPWSDDMLETNCGSLARGKYVGKNITKSDLYCMLSLIISSQYQICEILTKRQKIFPVGLNLIELGLRGMRTGKCVAECLIYNYIYIYIYWYHFGRNGCKFNTNSYWLIVIGDLRWWSYSSGHNFFRPVT